MNRRFALGLVLTSFAVACIAQGCGSTEDSVFHGNGADAGGDGSNTTASGGIGGNTEGGSGDDDGGNGGGECSVAGKSCGDGGVCAGGGCCAAQQACGSTCCSNDTVCSFQQCVTPGAVCRDSTDCAANEYCEYSLGSVSDAGAQSDAACVGGSDRTGKCLPSPPECADGGAPTADGPITCLQKCEYHPPTQTFAPTLKASWGGQTTTPFASDVMMAPIVIQLDDDDCDGKITERDIPEIVFETFKSGNYTTNGQLHAISLKNGAFVDKWTVPNATNTTVVYPTKQIAAGNFDGQPGNEVIACGVDGKVYAFKGVDGSVLWSTTKVMDCFMPSIADLDGDGAVEVIVEGGILDGATGAVKHTFDSTLDGPFVVSDIDGDNKLDIVTFARGYDSTGKKFVDTGMTTTPEFANTGDWKGPWAAVGDFDADGKPEVVAVDNETHTVHMWRYNAAKAGKFEIVRTPVDMNALFAASDKCPTGSWGATHGGGPPTIGDFNRDGVPDVALAGGIGYVVFDGAKLRDSTVTGKNAILWSKVTQDCSSASTGSTLFDFDGDGTAEVVYSDELRMRIYEGATGNELASVCNTTATLIEFPIVADVDNDGQADIVVISNAYDETCNETTDGGVAHNTKQSGVRIFGPATGSWVRTRRVWNEHAYHITNVNEDGTIPKPELANWTQSGLDNFRQNKQPGSEFAAPNLVGTIAPVCIGDGTITVTVRNVGEAVVPGGVVVGVYSGAPKTGTKLGTLTTSRPLYPAEGEPMDFTVPAGTTLTTVSIAIDDGAPAHPEWTECRTDDNTASAAAQTCAPGVK